MTTQNIQVGIDLGTTNSEIAINLNGNIELVKNIFGDEYTPSVFGVDRSGNKVAGKRAYEKLFKDGSEDEYLNYKAEIKRLMGTSDVVVFARIKQKMEPEEISAEILKSLKEDVLRKHPSHYVDGAVITVPAYFSTLQAEATKRAGNLAGFKHVVLIQEPIAAAIAYGFNNIENENWLIYDLGGGTFDVALISSRQGSLSVLGNSGNNFLGGKDFDWLIVDNVILPQILSRFSLKDFNRGNPQYRSTFAKLKYFAEAAKIYLSNSDNTTIEIEGIGKDNEDKEIYVNIGFNRSTLEQLIKPAIDQTISLAKEMIGKIGVNISAINKIVLVGGPTQIPYIKHRLESAFNIPVDGSVDPLTVVARGACIYAVSQRMPDNTTKERGEIKKGSKYVNLFCESMTSELEESVAGEIKDLKGEYYVQIQNDVGSFSSNKIPLKEGKFHMLVMLEPKKTNLFWVYLFDSKGNSIDVEPDSFTIVQGISLVGAPIPHSIGIAVAKQDNIKNAALIEVFEPFFEKNSMLPLKASRIYHTVKTVKKGDVENILPIKVYEGESDIPDRNQLICNLKVTGEMLPYDLQENEEVEITMEVNESREVKVEAYIPKIDLHLNARATIYDDNISVADLETDYISQIQRAKNIKDKCSADECTKLDNLIVALSTTLKNATIDADEKKKAANQIRQMKMDLDKLEKNKEINQLISEFNEGVADARKIIEEYANEKERDTLRKHFESIREEGEKAIENGDKHLLGRAVEQLLDIYSRAWFSNPSTWIHQLREISKSKHEFTNKNEAEYFINKGEKAITSGDVEELKRCVRNLYDLLPKTKQEQLSKNISGIKH